MQIGVLRHGRQRLEADETGMGATREKRCEVCRGGREADADTGGDDGLLWVERRRRHRKEEGRGRETGRRGGRMRRSRQAADMRRLMRNPLLQHAASRRAAAESDELCGRRALEWTGGSRRIGWKWTIGSRRAVEGWLHWCGQLVMLVVVSQWSLVTILVGAPVLSPRRARRSTVVQCCRVQRWQ